MVRKLRSAIALAALPILMGGCELTDSISEVFNVSKVSFSSAGYTGPEVTYSAPASLRLPNLSDFALKVGFRVVADNRGNTGKAAFGSDNLQLGVNLYIESLQNGPISTTIPAFTVDSGAVDTLIFPVSIPLSDIADRQIVRDIVNGDSIPYFLKGNLKFRILSGVSTLGEGSVDIDLATGKIPTRPSSSILSVLSKLL